MSATNKNFRIFLVLLAHDIKLLSTNIFSAILDSVAPLIAQTITFGYLFPLLGMPSYMIAPIYLGGMLSLFMQLGFTLTIKTSYDLTYNRFIDYQITLPISKRWLFAAFIINNMIEVILITLPLFGIGIIILKPQFNLALTNWFGLTLIYFLILAFFSTLYSAIAYTAQLRWILDNAWPRVLVPLWSLSSAIVLWKKTFAWSPIIGYIMLFSPFTYVAEGLRSAMLDTPEYISWQICALMLLLFISINLSVFAYGIKKRLDPV